MEAKNSENYRYERKIFITELSIYEVENLVKMHPAIFSEIYPKRYINNIYFDTNKYNNLYDNVDGAVDRMKIRIRWYGDLFGFIKKPVLEIKIKKQFLGKKISIPLKPFTLNEKTKISEIVSSDIDLHNSLMIDLKSMVPTLLNRYIRKYYQSSDKKYRITIDNKQSFYSINKVNNLFLDHYVDDVSVVLEIKYNREFDPGAKYIFSYFPFRMTKSSKYVNGVKKVFQVGF